MEIKKPTSMLRKEQIKDAGDYLSEQVTDPDPEIDAFVDLLFEMENAGDRPLVGGKLPKTHKEAAAILKTLTSFEDKIGKHDPKLKAEIETAMKQLMANVPLIGYTAETRKKVIEQQAGLLTSYLLLHGQKTDALNLILEMLNKTPDAMILRHGSARKSFMDAALTLHGKDPDQLLNVRSVDPIVARKLQIKLNNLMGQYLDQPFMSDVIDDVTNFLAVHLLLPQSMRVCKCMKSVFIQCELWNEEILRRVARPACTCSQSKVAERPTALSPGVKIDMKTCPTVRTYTKDGPVDPCPGSFKPGPCPATISAFVLQPEPLFDPATRHAPTRLRPATANIPLPEKETNILCTPGAKLATDFVLMDQNTWHVNIPCIKLPNQLQDSKDERSKLSDPMGSIDSPSIKLPDQLQDSKDQRSKPSDPVGSINIPSIKLTDQLQDHEHRSKPPEPIASTSYFSPPKSPSPTRRCASAPTSFQDPWNLFAQMQSDPTMIPKRNIKKWSPSPPPDVNDAPVVTTDQMADMYAMMVSLMWNMQAWRRWLQEILDRALATQATDLDLPPDQAYAEWVTFQNNVMKEALQWRQYIKFSRKLTLRLEDRYNDKKIVSPTRASNKTETYVDCQQEMLEITDMFNKWTQWLVAVVLETFKRQAWEHEGAVWVMSACGAVPSGAVAAGRQYGEVIWVVRTTHKSEVLPAALLPSKHCCLVYADGAMHKYSKYQIGAVLAPDYRCHVVIHSRPFTFECFELLVMKEKDNSDSKSDMLPNITDYTSSLTI